MAESGIVEFALERLVQLSATGQIKKQKRMSRAENGEKEDGLLASSLFKPATIADVSNGPALKGMDLTTVCD